MNHIFSNNIARLSSNRFLKRLLASFGAVLLVTAWSLPASAVIIDLNSDPNNGAANDILVNPVTILLNPTDTMTVQVIGIADGGAYDAWNRFGAVLDCTNGSNCAQGWETNWAAISNLTAGSVVEFGTYEGFETAELAQANKLGIEGPFSGLTFASFGISDSFFDDNIGGISLEVTVTPSAVPIPAAAWLFGSALLGLGAMKRKKA